MTEAPRDERPEASRRRWLWPALNVLVVIVFAVLIAVAGRPLAHHIRVLFAHLRSGSWEVVPDDEALAVHIRSVYGDSSKWVVHYVGGSLERFPLDRGVRPDTIQTVGHTVLSDTARLRTASVSLPDAYAGLLAEKVLSLGRPQADALPPELETLATLLRRSERRQRETSRAEIYQRAEASLARLPGSAPLRRALADFEEGEREHGLDFRSFEVFTKPSYDLDGAWRNGAVALDVQRMRCVGEASPFAANAEALPVDASVSVRALEVTLIRDWMSEEILDRSGDIARPAAVQFFGDGGYLNLVPYRMWVVMGDQVKLTTLPENAERFEKWIQGNACCSVKCEGGVMSLTPETVRVLAPGIYIGQVDAPVPELFAIVSRRRGLADEGN